MKHKLALLIIVILFALMTLACTDGGGGDTSTNSTQPTPTPHADTSAECYTRVYDECMTIGSATTCAEMAEATCVD